MQTFEAAVVDKIINGVCFRFRVRARQSLFIGITMVCAHHKFPLLQFLLGMFWGIRGARAMYSPCYPVKNLNVNRYTVEFVLNTPPPILIRRNVMTIRVKITSLLLGVFALRCFSRHRKSEMIMFKSGFQSDF